MSSNELVEQIMAQVIARVATPEQQAIPGQPQPIRETAMAEKSCSLTEFVGTAIGDTLGLVIANVDTALLDAMKLEKRYRSIGILGARTGVGELVLLSGGSSARHVFSGPNEAIDLAVVGIVDTLSR